MYVCLCHDIKDRQIATALHQGVDTLDKLKAALGVATCCGCCEPFVAEMVAAHHADLALLDQLATDADTAQSNTTQRLEKLAKPA